MNTIGIARQTEGRHYVYTPQILLQASASTVDVFRSLVVVHRIVYEVNRRTDECDWKHFTKRLFEDRVSRNSSSNVDAMSTRELIDIVEKAYTFQSRSVSALMELFSLSGWDMTRFTFGTIADRVEYASNKAAEANGEAS